MKKTCELCRHEQLCRAIFGKSESVLCGTSAFDFSDIEYDIDDFHDIFEFNKFLTLLLDSKVLPAQQQANVSLYKMTFDAIFKDFTKDSKKLLVERVNALEGLLSFFNKDIFNFFNLPKWFTNSEAGNTILEKIPLTPDELELADLLCKEYEEQYEKAHG